MRGVALFGVALVCVACKAQVGSPDLGSGGGEDLAGADAGVPPDLAGADLYCTVKTEEVCGNACDDDQNGWADAEDPICTPQLLVTSHGASFVARRLTLDSLLTTSDLEATVHNGVGSVSYAPSFAPALFVALETTRQLVRIGIPTGGVGVFDPPGPPAWPSTTGIRDVCVFNGELILVERGTSAPSRLHRMMPDGRTEIGVVSLGSTTATACASDGNVLYVAIHDLANPSQFTVLDKAFVAQGSPLPMPPALAADGYDRCLDLAYVHATRTFYGLFIQSMGALNDSVLSADQIHPFGFDGGISAPLDAGKLHGLGEFTP